MKKINVGIVGLGTIGSGVVDILQKNKSLGVDVHILKAADISLERQKKIPLPSFILTRNAKEIVNNPEIDIVVELIGGCTAARDIVINSLRNGKAVVTANKALLAEQGKDIFLASEKYGSDIYYEASVCGGIPIIKILREGLVANNISSILGIVNGTSNYILTKMQEEGSDFRVALEEAQKEGYAEKDPTFDIEGIDSAHKLVILSSLATGKWVDLKNVYREGISSITNSDILNANELGYVIKLLAVCKKNREGIQARVHPTLLSKNHQLSGVNGVYNAIFVTGDNVGNQLFYGKGAGKLPTASAVVADIVDIARNLSCGIKNRIPNIRHSNSATNLIPIDDVVSQCYLRFTTLDRPGVLAKIAGMLGKNQISIASVLQKERHKVSAVPIVVMTHRAVEKGIKKALKEIDKLPEVKAKTMMIRVEE